METLDLNNKRKREKLTASEWNSLIDAINLLILRYNLGATIPTKLSQLTNDAGFITDISGKADKSDLARVATTGSYNDLKDKPDLSNIGSAGKSAYELAVENGYQGTIQLWLLSLKGQDGTNGTNGQDGTNGTNGSDGITPHIDSTTGNWFIGETNTGVSAQGPLGIQGETGALGSQGILGIQGPQGPTGTDGITPTVSITNITGGHNVAFSYGAGDSRNIDFDVMDGSLADLVQADWNQSDNTQPDYVKNKPLVYTKSEADNKFVANHDYVEIGGVKWATMNLGANSVTDVGLYFLWGDIQGYTASQVGSGEGQKYFSWEDYKYGNGTSDPGDDITKYNKIDGERFLNACDDAARLVTGGKWRMPTLDEILALANNSTITSVSNYNGTGVSGALFTSTTNPSATLFFPFSGYGARSGSGISTSSHTFSFWSNEKPLGSTLVPKAYVLYCHDGLHIDSEGNVAYGLYVDSYYNDSDRYIGKVIRPVLDDVNAEVAYTGDYNDLSNIPDVYTKNESDLQFVKNEYVKIGNYIWSTKNLGASYKTDIGLTFLWGNLVPEIATNAFNDFRGDINNNRFYDSGQQTYIKYNDSIGYLTTDIEDEDDAVINIMGGSWIMPKERHIHDLFQNSTQQYIENYENSGVKGFLFTDSSDSTKQLFFPVLDRGSHTYAYWVGSILNTPDEDTTAGTIWFYMGSSDVNDYRPISNIREWRNTVLPIRPVLNNSYQKTIKESLDLTSDLGKIFAFKSELSNCVQTSNTSGLLKNDGTVDTNSYSKVWSGTQALYDALSSYDSNTIYIIT